MERAEGTFEITAMGEDTYAEIEGAGKLARANGTQRFAGDIEGEGSVEWLMAYEAEGGARFLGLQRIEGSIAGRTGSLVMEAIGDFDGERSKGTWTILPGSATGALTGITGGGGFEASSGPNATYTLEYGLS